MSTFNDITSGADQLTYGSFKEELRDMPRMHRIVVYMGLVFMLCLFLESILILPTIILKWGWGYTVG